MSARWARLACKAATVLLAGAASAGAQQPRACLEDAMIVFDASKSMAASDDDNKGLRRIDSVRGALAKVLPRVAPKRRLGLMSYGPGSAPDACQNVTLDFPPAPNDAKQIVDRVNGLLPEGSLHRDRVLFDVSVRTVLLQVVQAPALVRHCVRQGIDFEHVRGVV